MEHQSKCYRPQYPDSGSAAIHATIFKRQEEVLTTRDNGTAARSATTMRAKTIETNARGIYAGDLLSKEPLKQSLESNRSGLGSSRQSNVKEGNSSYMSPDYTESLTIDESVVRYTVSILHPTVTRYLAGVDLRKVPKKESLLVYGSSEARVNGIGYFGPENTIGCVVEVKAKGRDSFRGKLDINSPNHNAEIALSKCSSLICYAMKMTLLTISSRYQQNMTSSTITPSTTVEFVTSKSASQFRTFLETPTLISKRHFY